MQDKPLYGMFISVPPRYDLINKALTFGLDKNWRNMAARECLNSQPERMLDLCCGTGDLAVSLALLAGPGIEITGLDYSQPMLEIAQRKAGAANQKITFTRGNASELPFSDGYFDCIGISFGFRNLTYKNPLADRHIAEILRVLRKGGKFVIVESSQPTSALIRGAFHLYLRAYVYGIGSLLSGNRGAYHYLAESAARFYSPDELEKLLLSAGFSRVFHQSLMMGATGIHTAVK